MEASQLSSIRRRTQHEHTRERTLTAFTERPVFSATVSKGGAEASLRPFREQSCARSSSSSADQGVASRAGTAGSDVALPGGASGS
jgi:hypothetical protein